jgi:hypothetical protein
MLNKQNRTVTAVVLLFSVVSCEKNIEFNGKTQAPLLVINSILSPDSSMLASASKSIFFLSNDENTAIENADINVFVNDEPAGKYTFSHTEFTYNDYNGQMDINGQSYYLLPRKPKAGDRIRYEASAPGLESVTAETVIPQPTEIISLETELVKDPANYQNGYGMDFRMKFRDRPNEKNYYRIALYVKSLIYNRKKPSESYIHIFPVDITSDDMVLDTSAPTDGFLTEETPNRYTLFSDELIEGKEYTVKFHSSLTTTSASYSDDQWLEVIVRFLSITEDYYLYLRTLTASSQAGDTPFTEPVQIYNNIKGGIGILGAFSASENTVNMERELSQKHANDKRR